MPMIDNKLSLFIIDETRTFAAELAKPARQLAASGAPSSYLKSLRYWP